MTGPRTYPCIQVLFLASLVFRSTSSFSSSEPHKDKLEPHQQESFHIVLEKVGKTVFRPGGSEATEQLHKWAVLSAKDSVIELSAGLGTGGMALASKYQCHVLLTDRDEDRLLQANKLAERKGLQDWIQTQRVDFTRIDQDLADEQFFDAAIIEASLTHYPTQEKLAILRQLRQHSRLVLLHEICLKNDNEKQATTVKREVGSALAIGFHPLTQAGWKHVLEQAGFTVTRTETGPIRFLTPSSLLKDEGPKGVAKIAWNLATQHDLRERVVSTRAVIDSHKENLGYIIIRADAL